MFDIAQTDSDERRSTHSVENVQVALAALYNEPEDPGTGHGLPVAHAQPHLKTEPCLLPVALDRSSFGVCETFLALLQTDRQAYELLGFAH